MPEKDDKVKITVEFSPSFDDIQELAKMLPEWRVRHADVSRGLFEIERKDGHVGVVAHRDPEESPDAGLFTIGLNGYGGKMEGDQDRLEQLYFIKDRLYDGKPTGHVRYDKERTQKEAFKAMYCAAKAATSIKSFSDGPFAAKYAKCKREVGFDGKGNIF